MAAALAREIARCLPADRKDPLGVAVSGGGDSLALLHLLCDLTRDTGPRLAAVTVDHGLRPESADEAAMVGSVCAGLGVEHEVLRWDGWDGQGNLQDRARQARYELIAVWAGKRGIGRVALGHTQDDQAETVLMGLARGAGVDGLSAMAPTMNRNGIEWLRPMLGLRRQDLRAYLSGKGVTWADDPSNEDSRFERIRVRQALSALADVGIGVPGLAEVATRMRSARDALTARTDAAAREIARIEAGAVVLDRAAFLGLEEEIARRLLLRALCWINGSRHAPRRAAARQEELWSLFALERAAVAVVSAKRSKGWRKVATTSPSSQEQFESTKLSRRRFSRAGWRSNSA